MAGNLPWLIGFESGLKRLILARNIRSRSWQNYDDLYGKSWTSMSTGRYMYLLNMDHYLSMFEEF